MAHWAEVDENNIVLRVVVGSNNNADEGYQWLIDNLGGTWLKTSYNTYHGEHTLGGTPYRKNFAIPGGSYDANRDAFIPPKPTHITDPNVEIVFNEETCDWDFVAIEPIYPVFEE
jgi:hypothetical protein